MWSRRASSHPQRPKSKLLQLLGQTLSRILIPVPSLGFDPSETAIPWKLWTAAGLEVVFATPFGKVAAADPLMLSGRGLGICGPLLRARKDAVDAYQEMQASAEFRNPGDYAKLREKDFDALLLPGGHDKSVKEYLESKILQRLVGEFFAARKPVAAICHGVVLAARSLNPNTGKSVLFGYQTTCLLKSQELLAYRLTKWWMGDYYRTYPEITVEDEVRAALAQTADFQAGPRPLLRDDGKHLKRGFVVRDRNYLSSRWPGDVYSFSHEFVRLLQQPHY